MNNDFSQRISSKNDEDPILELKQISVDNLEEQLVYLGDIPFYASSTQELLALSLKKLEYIRDENKTNDFYGAQHVMPLNPYTFSFLRNSRLYFYLSRESFINLPAGSGMLWMSKRLKKPLVEMTRTIAYTMNLIRLANAKEYTIFIVGSKFEVLEKLSANLKRSYPHLRLVGKHHGYLKGDGHQKVMEALQKTDPHIILLGLGFKKELRWISENKHSLGNCILVNVGGDLDILAGVRKKAPSRFELSGNTWLWRILSHPIRFFRIFTILFWRFKVHWWALWGKDGKVSFH